MEFIAIRTSDWYPTISNCDEAKEVEFGDIKYSIVEINSLDDLIKFIDKYGSVVIEKQDVFGASKPEHEYIIEIYDDWRE